MCKNQLQQTYTNKKTNHETHKIYQHVSYIHIAIAVGELMTNLSSRCSKAQTVDQWIHLIHGA